MEIFLLQSALKENLRIKRLWPWIMMAGVSFLIALGWYSISRVPDQQGIYSQVSLSIVFKMVALASAIFSTAAIGQEVEQKTIVYVVTRPVERWKIILSRYLATSIVVAGIGILCAIAVSLAVYRLNAFGNPLLWRDLIALIVAAFAYSALFLFISLLLNRAMLWCLLYAFGWETLVPNMPGDATYLSIFSYTSTIAAHPADSARGFLAFVSGQMGDNTMTTSTAWSAIVIMSAGLAVLSALWFTHFEYVPREDAE